MGNNHYSDEQLLLLAKKRVRIKRSIYSHIMKYVTVNSFLVFIYLIDNEPNEQRIPWIIWPLVGWGVGLILDVVGKVQDLRLTHNTNAVDKELAKIKSKLK